MPDPHQIDFEQPAYPRSDSAEQRFAESTLDSPPMHHPFERGPFILALAYGLVAAAVGCVIYALVEIYAHITIGYLAIGVGFLIGKAIHLGAKGRGGKPYQVAAVALTYLGVSMAEAVVLYHQISLERHVRLIPYNLMLFAKFGILSPFTDFENSFGGAAIGLFILFLGMRFAWRFTAVRPPEL